MSLGPWQRSRPQLFGRSLHRTGDVIIAHMNKPAGASAEAMAVVLPELQARGWRFVRLSQGRLEPQR